MYMRWGKLYKGTPAEHAIEPAVAALGLVYRTQYPGFLYGFRFYPDFFLPQIGIVIEVDDPSHNKADKIIADAERTEALESRGWRVFRCTNDEALSDPHGAVRAILRDAGITPRDIESARRRPLSECLPRPGKCPQKVKREAKSAATRRRRSRKASAPPAAPKPTTPPQLPLLASSSPPASPSPVSPPTTESSHPWKRSS